jgi:hydroxyethylthiazole kinase-like uncharacterized protein yjeF
MKPAFTFDEIRAAEKSIIEKEKIPSIILMENAGKNSFDVLLEKFPDLDDYNIYIICGKGNNAGDGFVLARHLLVNGYPVKMVLLENPSVLKGDALINYELLKKHSKHSSGNIEYISFSDFPKYIKNGGSSIIIDAILGTGIKGELNRKFSDAITLINKLKNKHKKLRVVSLDVPSGLTGYEHEVHTHTHGHEVPAHSVNPVVKADITISMGAVKTELLFGEGKENSGEVVIVSIGLTYSLIEKYNTGNKYSIGLNDVKQLFPGRKSASYKYSNGKVLVIGGSKGLSGSIMMSAYSAIKAGAGGVAAAIPRSISRSFNKKLFEVMTVELDETPEGTIEGSNSAANGNAIPDKIVKRTKWADAVLLGPGISTNDSVKGFVFDIIRNCDKPLVIDADGLNVLASDVSVLNKRKFKNEIILTPHLGEFARLSEISIDEIVNDRFRYAVDFARQYKVNLVIKSETTFSCAVDGRVYINSSGNEALATAGTGDILSGIITSILSQSKDAVSAMVCGNYIHGLCADLYYSKYGNKQTASPRDIIKLIPKAVSKVIKSS